MLNHIKIVSIEGEEGGFHMITLTCIFHTIDMYKRDNMEDHQRTPSCPIECDDYQLSAGGHNTIKYCIFIDFNQGTFEYLTTFWSLMKDMDVQEEFLVIGHLITKMLQIKELTIMKISLKISPQMNVLKEMTICNLVFLQRYKWFLLAPNRPKIGSSVSTPPQFCCLVCKQQ